MNFVIHIRFHRIDLGQQFNQSFFFQNHCLIDAKDESFQFRHHHLSQKQITE